MEWTVEAINRLHEILKERPQAIPSDASMRIETYAIRSRPRKGGETPKVLKEDVDGWWKLRKVFIDSPPIGQH